MPISIYEGVILVRKAFVMEENIFRNCTLIECSLFYSGGVVEWVNTNFQNCTWGFRGPAKETIQVLSMLGLLKSGPPQPIATPSTTGQMN